MADPFIGQLWQKRKEIIIEGLSTKIRRFRFENDEMTQKELASRVGVSRQTMNAIENGRHAPTIAVAIKIADVFAVTVDELFAFDYDGKPKHRPIVSPAEPTQPAYRAERGPQTSIGKTESIEPAEPSRQSSTKNAPQDQKALLASLRNVIG